VRQILLQDFDDETPGQAPAGWTVTPAGAAVVAANPGGSGRCAALSLSATGTAIGRAEVSPAVSSGKVWFGFKTRVAHPAGVGDLRLRALGPAGEVLFGVVMSTLGDFRDMANQPFDIPRSWSADVWYAIVIEADLGTRTYSVWIDLDPVGEDLAFPGDASALAAVQFVVTAAGAANAGYFDTLDFSARYSAGEPPTRLTLVTGFVLDAATVTTAKDGQSPDRFSASFSGANVLSDALARSWRSADASAGTRDLVFDFGNGVAKRPRFVSVHGHNLGQVTANLEAVALLGSSDADWEAPDLAIDLYSQAGIDPIVAWLPAGDPLRYWCLRIVARTGGLLGVDYIEIGRVCGHDAPFTVSQGPSVNHEWGIVDPSIITRMEGGASQARVKTAQRTLEVAWRGIPIADQEAIEALWRSSGMHAPWVVLLDPADRPQTRTLYAYASERDVVFQRRHAEAARLTLTFTEIVA
jgi:hypothetical protein